MEGVWASCIHNETRTCVIMTTQYVLDTMAQWPGVCRRLNYQCRPGVQVGTALGVLGLQPMRLE